MSSRFSWCAAGLLIPQPVGSLLYLVLMRQGLMAPTLLPLVVLQLFPVAAVVWLSRSGGRRIAGSCRAWLWAVAGVEIVWGLVALMIVRIATAWRLGGHV